MTMHRHCDETIHRHCLVTLSSMHRHWHMRQYIVIVSYIYKYICIYIHNIHICIHICTYIYASVHHMRQHIIINASSLSHETIHRHCLYIYHMYIYIYTIYIYVFIYVHASQWRCIVPWRGFDASSWDNTSSLSSMHGQNYRSLLQKRPIKETLLMHHHETMHRHWCIVQSIVVRIQCIVMRSWVIYMYVYTNIYII